MGGWDDEDFERRILGPTHIVGRRDGKYDVEAPPEGLDDEVREGGYGGR